MRQSYSGLAVVPTKPASMKVIVERGRIAAGDRVIELAVNCFVSIREAGQRQFVKQSYQMFGKGTSSPSGWNGESIRGSGGTPYQRMVPGTLQVFSEDRTILYTPEVDYIQDSYWGTIKNHPQGRIKDGQELSLDYAVWLCRYDAIVLKEDGTIQLVEGDSEAPESRELLLPEPPVVKSGFVLAHVFAGWGQTCINGGESFVSEWLSNDSSLPADKTLPTLIGRYEDMVERTYVIDVAATEAEGQYEVRTGATGEDYGTNNYLTLESLRWTQPKLLPLTEPLPLLFNSAYGFVVDWGLDLDLSLLRADASVNLQGRYIVHAVPDMIFDRRQALFGEDPVESIPFEQKNHLNSFREKANTGAPLRIAFFGASYTSGGRWPYQVMDGLKLAYPNSSFHSSNIAYGGEGTIHGLLRFEKEVLAVKPDFILLEYMVNDAFSGDPERIENNLRLLLGKIEASGIPCLIATINGVNPLFTQHSSSRNMLFYHELYRRLAAEFGMAFVGGHKYYANLHLYGKFCLTEFKGNMISHCFGFQDTTWAPFDHVLSKAIIKMIVNP